MHLKVCDISGTSTKKIIKETDLEILRCIIIFLVKCLPGIGSKMRRDVVSEELSPWILLYLRERRNFATGFNLSYANV